MTAIATARRAALAAAFGGRLAAARKKTQLTQDDLADRAQVHRTEVSIIERGGQ